MKNQIDIFDADQSNNTALGIVKRAEKTVEQLETAEAYKPLFEIQKELLKNLIS